MDPVEKREKQLADYENKAFKKIKSNNVKKQKANFYNLLIFTVLISVSVLTVLFFLGK